MPGIRKTLKEFKNRTLHSGSKNGPVVTNRKQAIAIAMNQAREERGESNDSAAEDRAEARPFPPKKSRRPTIGKALGRVTRRS